MAKQQAIVGEIVHSVGARYRIRGAGMLQTRMKSMDGIRTVELEDIFLETKAPREKTIIANFQDQGIQILFRTIHIDEVFTLSKIVCFVKPVAESYPILKNARD